MPISKRVGYGRSNISNVISSLQTQREQANQANLARFREAQGLYDRIISQYEPGGTFGQGIEARLGRLRTQTLASGMQNLVTSGLANTTMAGTMAGRFAEEVAAPTMLQLEDLRTQRLSSALEGKASLLSMMEDVGPSSELIAQLSAQVGTGGVTRTLSPRAAAGLDVFGQPLGKYSSRGQTSKVRGTPATSGSGITRRGHSMVSIG